MYLFLSIMFSIESFNYINFSYLLFLIVVLGLRDRFFHNSSLYTDFRTSYALPEINRTFLYLNVLIRY